MALDLPLDTLSMTEIIRLQTLLSQELTRRFEVSATVCFTDVVGSTAYFARFGDARGRQLQQLHVDALERALQAHGGRLVDTAGDGAVSVFADAAQAALAMCALQQDLNAANRHRERDHQIVLRVGLHHGRVLTDGVQVTGDVMNLCARIAASAEPGQIRLSHDCFRELDNLLRLRCRPLGDVALKGAGRAIALLSLHWLDRSRFPVALRVRETGEQIDLPLQDIISFGRLDIIEGMPANDVVLALPDVMATRQISRWHVELRRRPDGYVLRSVSTHPTVVDGRPLQRGDEAPALPGSVVVLSGVITLDLLGRQQADDAPGDATMVA
jgi:class 3 adenylate cyclase